MSDLPKALYLIIGFAFASLNTAKAQYTIAEFFPTDFDYADTSTSPTYQMGQTFTALSDGQLEAISIALEANSTSSSPLGPITVELRPTANGIPLSSILATSTIDGTLLTGDYGPSPVMLNADFSSYDVELTAGTMYAFSLTLDLGAVYVCGSLSESYAGGAQFTSANSGTTWVQNGTAETQFQVTAIPEPSTLALALLALAALTIASIVPRRCLPRRQ